MKFFILFAAILAVASAGVLHGGYISSGLAPVSRVVSVVEPAPVVSVVSTPVVHRVAAVPVVKVVEPVYAVRHASIVHAPVVHSSPVLSGHSVYGGIWKQK